MVYADTTKFMRTAGVCVLCVPFSALGSLDVFGVGSLCEAGVVSTLGGVTLARRSRWTGLTVGPGVSRFSLCSCLSRASVFAVARHAGGTWGEGGSD